MRVEVVDVDFRDPAHAEDLRYLCDAYARDAMGQGKPLHADVLSVLPQRLAEFPTALSVIGYVDGKPAGLANCFFGFSTFAARKLINVHDVVVLSEFRGHGVSRRLFERIEQIAAANDCCKLTLEVLEHNDIAVTAYRNFGFENYELDPAAGRALFMEKKLPPAPA